MSMTFWLIVMACGLGIAAVITVARMITGPTILDRAVGSDMILVLVVAALGLYTAASGTAYAIPAMLSLTGLGFLGTLAVARFVGREATPGEFQGQDARGDAGDPAHLADAQAAGEQSEAADDAEVAGEADPIDGAESAEDAPHRTGPEPGPSEEVGADAASGGPMPRGGTVRGASEEEGVL